MKIQTSFSIPKKIETSEKVQVAEKRINELKTLIKYWRQGNFSASFWEEECSKHPSSPSCLMFDN